MEDFLARVGQHLDAESPHLRPLFNVMAGEGRFARAWLDVELKRLPEAAPILEVGGGVFLLSCQLAREGFSVTAIEPTGVGFGAFEELGATILTLAAQEDAVPTIIRCPVETFCSDVHTSLAFSVNVMEHVAAPDVAIARVSAVLSPGGCYRFLCPNYLFPYEPHFNIPTFGSKSVTWKLMRSRIEGNTDMDDPTGLWQSLNWITVPEVRRMAAADESLVADFRTSTLAWMLERTVSDAEFASRRASWMISAIRALGVLRMFRLASLVPAICQPIMDVRLIKRA